MMRIRAEALVPLNYISELLQSQELPILTSVFNHTSEVIVILVPWYLFPFSQVTGVRKEFLFYGLG